MEFGTTDSKELFHGIKRALAAGMTIEMCRGRKRSIEQHQKAEEAEEERRKERIWRGKSSLTCKQRRNQTPEKPPGRAPPLPLRGEPRSSGAGRGPREFARRKRWKRARRC
ncbi:uncharacterized protein M6G45_013460 isoform 2-T3 [Spheniscus humboldti]